MNIIETINKYPDYLFEYIVNIYLVLKGVRKATLFETVNIAKNPKDIEYMLTLSREVGLVYFLENKQFGRYLVALPDTMAKYLVTPNKESDNVLGSYLGFLCNEHDYFNINVNRISCNIFISYKNLKTHIVFVCEKNKIDENILKEWIRKKTQEIRDVLPKEFNIYGELKNIDSNLTRIDNIKKSNLEYIRKNIDEYLDHFYNYWKLPSKISNLFISCLDSKSKFNKNKSIFLFIWRGNFTPEEIDTLDNMKLTDLRSIVKLK